MSKWIATTNMKKFENRPDYKPSGMWKCRGCGAVQHGSTLYKDMQYTVDVWTCSDLSCGAVCDRIPSEIFINEALNDNIGNE